MVGYTDVGNVENNDEFYKSMREMYTKKNLSFITDISQKQIIALTKVACLYEWSDRKIKPLKYLIDNFQSFSISKNRQSRKEFFETLKGHFTDEMNRIGGLSKFFAPRG